MGQRGSWSLILGGYRIVGRERHQVDSLCPIPFAASASAWGGSEGGSGAEAGGGDARLEMKKVRRGYIAYDGRGSPVLGRVFRGSVIVRQLHEKRREGKKRHMRALILPGHIPSIPPSAIRRSTRGSARMRHPTQTTHPTPWNHNRMRPPMSMVNTKRRRGSPRNTIIHPGPSRPRGPHTAYPVCGG